MPQLSPLQSSQATSSGGLATRSGSIVTATFDTSNGYTPTRHAADCPLQEWLVERRREIAGNLYSLECLFFFLSYREGVNRPMRPY